MCRRCVQVFILAKNVVVTSVRTRGGDKIACGNVFLSGKTGFASQNV